MTLSSVTTATAPAPRTLQRATGGRVLGGVAAGLGEHLGLSPVVVRLAFGALTLAGGAGLAVYGALWVFAPQRQEPGEPAGTRGQLLALGIICAGVLLLLQQVGVLQGRSGVFPLAVAVAGVALVWRQADEAQRSRWRATA
ncbi:MAG: signal transduction histidine kinase, partial [Frankiales bacterium]|nr:signal transduction histidine kinase [Frankiales bacterium]